LLWKSSLVNRKALATLRVRRWAPRHRTYSRGTISPSCWDTSGRNAADFGFEPVRLTTPALFFQNFGRRWLLGSRTKDPRPDLWPLVDRHPSDVYDREAVFVLYRVEIFSSLAHSLQSWGARWAHTIVSFSRQSRTHPFFVGMAHQCQ